MKALLAQRLLALAAGAVLAVVAGLAIAHRRAPASHAASKLPLPAITDVSRWYAAVAGVRSRPLAGRPSRCGTLLGPKTLGVDHPVLPCGTKLFLRFDKKTVLTTVVDRGPFGPSREFEVTPALADLLGLTGTQSIRWSFARAR